ncbi:uncharacterized protein Dwil_GK14368 [Drosophila willistoni]|uniref:Zinc finger protein weckle n=2 Tax=Drosophila willistoni TaxID=7260 RepID=B4NIZ5_DROWI|nr:uncharacterized protein Dwil_GK14368 [Drosophila willistoni]
MHSIGAKNNNMVERYLEPQWLSWCRLCASDEGEIKLNDDSIHGEFVRTISKCFDVEMTLEEPELGSMLCHDCYTSISQLISFGENINKVQAIFELLRHTESNEQLDVTELRRQYGLAVTRIKAEPPDEYSVDDSEIEDNFNTVVDEDLEEEEEIRSADYKEEEPKETPPKRKRGRPKTVEVLTRMPKNVNKINEIDFSISKRVKKKTASSIDKNDIAHRTCQICQVTLGTVSALWSHRYRIHGNQNRCYICDCCGKQLKTFTALNEHKLVHTEDRPCVCPICNAAFKNKARLRVHSQTHGEPSYQCNICGKKLQTRAILNKHKYVHSEERRFKCEVCGTGCKNSTALKVHLLSHAGLRPYVCKYCGKAFASNTNCRSHKLKQHAEEVEQDNDAESSRIAVPTLEELRAITREMPKTKMESKWTKSDDEAFIATA